MRGGGREIELEKQMGEREGETDRKKGGGEKESEGTREREFLIN